MFIFLIQSTHRYFVFCFFTCAQWKSRNQIAYSQQVPPGQSRDRDFPDAHVHTCAPKQHAQDEAGCSQNEDIAFKVQKSSNAMEDDGVFEKIDDLLRKVNELAAEVPTTFDCLSCIAGIFPEGHGPREESMKEATSVMLLSLVVYGARHHTFAPLLTI